MMKVPVDHPVRRRAQLPQELTRQRRQFAPLLLGMSDPLGDDGKHRPEWWLGRAPESP